MELLMNYLKENKKLISLNICHNNLIEGFSGNNQKQVAESEQNVCDYLYTFLRTDRKLIHLDLTSTNLSENAIIHILPAIRRAKSLQGIHLSGNPGVTDAVKAEAAQLLKAKKPRDLRRINLLQFLD